MATSIYGDHPGSRRVGMMLWNLSAHEVRIPSKTVIGKVQTAKIVPNVKTPDHTSEVLPLEEQKGPLQVSPIAQMYPKMSWPGQSLYLHSWEPDVLTSEHDVLEKVDPSVCTKWDPEDQQEVRKILRECADV